VHEGLKAGDLVVVNGAQRVHPGITVTPQRVAMTPDQSGTSPAAVQN